MTSPERKIAQFLREARATERGLSRVLESQIAVAPGGDYRRELQLHLRQTREHAHGLRRRIDRLGGDSPPIQRFVDGIVSRCVGVATFPLSILRKASEPELVLRNAQEACAAEAHGIATYTAIERLASRAGDDETAALARSIREQQQEMFARMQAQLSPLTDAMVASDIEVCANHRNVPGVEAREQVLDGAEQRPHGNGATH